MNQQFLYVPFLPLPNVVFFPHQLLPLHIFEPRYKKLLEAILAGDRIMGVGLLKPGWEKNYYECPGVYRVMGIGKIIEHEKLSNGNYNIWLSGLERVRVIYEVQDKPFRVAKVQTVQDNALPAKNTGELMQVRREMVEAAYRLADFSPSISPDLHKGVDEHHYPGALADFIASHVCHDIYEKQCFLSEPDLIRRMRMATVQVNTRLREAIARQLSAADPTVKESAAPAHDESKPPDSQLRPATEF